ncbi:MAG: ArnT family glycosyltransferase [Thermosulfidibacteraceae bacterium]|jgi:4-amino-4-deoxy-L-arabinose transferase-like glycosyltransferase
MEEKKKMLIIIIVGIVFCILFNWTLSFTSLDEGRNASATRTMMETKNFIVPYYNCTERFEKPPMLYWVGSVSGTIFGINEFSFRLVSGISGILVAIVTYLIAKDLFNEEIGFRASLILIATPHFWVESRAYVPEMLLVLFMCLSMFYMIRERFVYSWLTTGSAFLTKGPVSLLAPITYLINTRNRKLLNLKGILIFILVGISWYVIMLLKFGYRYFYKFFLFEQAYRFLGVRKLQPLPPYFFILLILVNFVIYIPKIKNIFLESKKVFNNPKTRIIIIWALFTTLFYSLSKNKLHHYILFAYPAFSILIALGIDNRYLKKALTIYSMLFIITAILAIKYEQMRFVPKAENIVKIYKGNVYFYRTENSAIVFYSKRCISKMEDTENPKEGLIITKKKYLDRFGNCTLITKGKEIPDELVLLDCKVKEEVK